MYGNPFNKKPFQIAQATRIIELIDENESEHGLNQIQWLQELELMPVTRKDTTTENSTTDLLFGDSIFATIPIEDSPTATMTTKDSNIVESNETENSTTALLLDDSHDITIPIEDAQTENSATISIEDSQPKDSNIVEPNETENSTTQTENSATISIEDSQTEKSATMKKNYCILN